VINVLGSRFVIDLLLVLFMLKFWCLCLLFSLTVEAWWWNS